MNGVPGLNASAFAVHSGLIPCHYHISGPGGRLSGSPDGQRRLSEAAARLPIGIEPPRMAPLTGSTSLVLVVGLTSKIRTQMELRNLRRLGASPETARRRPALRA